MQIVFERVIFYTKIFTKFIFIYLLFLLYIQHANAYIPVKSIYIGHTEYKYYLSKNNILKNNEIFIYVSESFVQHLWNRLIYTNNFIFLIDYLGTEKDTNLLYKDIQFIKNVLEDNYNNNINILIQGIYTNFIRIQGEEKIIGEIKAKESVKSMPLKYQIHVYRQLRF